MNRKAKGSRRERQITSVLSNRGYSYTRAAASLGAWDIIAMNDRLIILIQAKSNCWPGKKEMQKLKDFKIPDSENILKLVWRIDDQKGGKGKKRIHKLRTVMGGWRWEITKDSPFIVKYGA